MAEFGDIDPLIDHDEEDKDDDDEDSEEEVDTTTPFQPGGSSTPGPSGEDIEMTTMNREKEKGSETAETSFIEGETYSRVLTLHEKAWDTVEKIFPNAKATELDVSYSKTGKLQVKMFGFGKKNYVLYTMDKSTGIERLNPSLPKEIKSALGLEAESLIAQEKEEIKETQKRLREAEKQLKEAEKFSSEAQITTQKVKDFRSRLERTQAKIDALSEEQGSSLENEAELRRLKQVEKNLKNDIANEKQELEYFQKQVKAKEKEQAKVDKLKADLAKKQKERNNLEERLNTTKPIDELNELEAELKKQIEKDKIILEDENTSSQLRAEAEERVAENEEELARLGTQIEERERAMPLREKIKNIFKKYGFTVGAVFLAVGTIIGVIVNALTKGLKSVSKGVGNALKDLGKKIGQLLPGLIGTIVSFIFKTAGQVIGFLGKNAWLLILAVAVFMVERIQKKN